MLVCNFSLNYMEVERASPFQTGSIAISWEHVGQILRPHSRGTESDTLGTGHGNLCLHNPFRQLSCTWQKFEKH